MTAAAEAEEKYRPADIHTKVSRLVPSPLSPARSATHVGRQPASLLFGRRAAGSTSHDHKHKSMSSHPTSIYTHYLSRLRTTRHPITTATRPQHPTSRVPVSTRPAASTTSTTLTTRRSPNPDDHHAHSSREQQALQRSTPRRGVCWFDRGIRAVSKWAQLCARRPFVAAWCRGGVTKSP